jgi:hypothetical protein
MTRPTNPEEAAIEDAWDKAFDELQQAHDDLRDCNYQASHKTVCGVRSDLHSSYVSALQRYNEIAAKLTGG